MMTDVPALLREWSDRDLGTQYAGNREASLGYIAARQIEELRAECDALRAALWEAADDIASWGAYAGEYFQHKHRLADNVQKYRDAALARRCTCLGNDDIGHTGSCPRL